MRPTNHIRETPVEDDLARWILSVDRRALAMRAIDADGAFSAAEIAERSGRSIQNISRAIHELEVKGLIECLNPEKHTWKRYLLTDHGKAVVREMKQRLLIK